MKFVHITDTHIMPPGVALYGLDPAARLRAAVDEINANHADAAFVVHTGDLAHRGEREAYLSLRAELDRLRIPFHAVPGNHDRRETLREVFPEMPATADGFLQHALDTDAGRFLFLDSIVPGSPAGRLCSARLTWLGEELARAGDMPLYVFLHHSPVALGIPNLDGIGLLNGDAFGQALACGNVRHLFFGHVHRPAHGVWRGIPFSTLRSMVNQSALVFEPLPGILDNLEPPGMAIVRIDANGDVVINDHDFLDSSPRFFISGPEAVEEHAPPVDLTPRAT